MSLQNRNRNFKKIMEEPNAEGRQDLCGLALCLHLQIASKEKIH